MGITGGGGWRKMFFFSFWMELDDLHVHDGNARYDAFFEGGLVNYGFWILGGKLKYVVPS